MLWVPQKGVIRYEHNFGNVGATTLGTSVSTGNPASTKGTAVELIASTAFDSYMMCITAAAYGAAATTSRGCLDILVGAATEEVLIANLLMGFCGNIAVTNAGPKTWWFPLYVPSGTRIAAQVAGNRTSTAMRVGIQLYGGSGYPPWRVGQRVDTYGIGTVPAATSVTPGASAAEGSWTEITSSTTRDCFCIVPSAQGPTGDTTLTASGVWMDIGVGAATEEVVAGGGNEQSYVFALNGDEMISGPFNPFPTFADIPSASRLTARLSRSSAADTTANWECALHCVS
jgi:hypothetical protein